MPLFLLIGQDQYQIQQQITKLKARLNPDWLAFNAHAYSAEQLSDANTTWSEALATARTLPIFDNQRLVLVENCQFQQFTERHFELLQSLVLPAQTILVFTGCSIDRRLKIVKLLLKLGKLQEFDTIPPWRTDLIESAIAAQAKHRNLQITRSAVGYLASAIGNDFARIDAELEKISVYANGQLIAMTTVQRLVSHTMLNSIKLAAAIRVGNTERVIQLLNGLLSQGEVPLVIITTLLTQFRTWLWVKSALIAQTNLKDADLAESCGITNPKRLYYIRKEVSAIAVSTMIRAVTHLFDVEQCLKQGANSEIILPALVEITAAFKSRSAPKIGRFWK